MLTPNHVKKYCQYACGINQCMFLNQDDTNPNVFYCLKKSGLASDIKEEVKLFKKEMKSQGQDINLMGVPISDNCSGYPIFYHIDQGYDAP